MLRLVLSTFPEEEAAASAGRQLVEEHRAACVNIVPGIRSIYHWEGKLEDSREVLAIFKVPAPAAESFMARLRELHPYEVPEIIIVAPDAVLPAYSRWVAESCGIPEH